MVSQEPAKLSTVLSDVWVRIPSPPPCPISQANNPAGYASKNLFTVGVSNRFLLDNQLFDFFKKI